MRKRPEPEIRLNYLLAGMKSAGLKNQEDDNYQSVGNEGQGGDRLRAMAEARISPATVMSSSACLSGTTPKIAPAVLPVLPPR
jgi:hypothetical protein